jgi:hypothetical protein
MAPLELDLPHRQSPPSGADRDDLCPPDAKLARRALELFGEDPFGKLADEEPSYWEFCSAHERNQMRRQFRARGIELAPHVYPYGRGTPPPAQGQMRGPSRERRQSSQRRRSAGCRRAQARSPGRRPDDDPHEPELIVIPLAVSRECDRALGGRA